MPNLRRLRFTPTGVGSSTDGVSHPVVVEVHPHRRGEQVSKQVEVPKIIGSPPQAWGAARA